MDLDDLKTVLVPPRQPIETGDERAWAQVERTLGTALPGDYKGFIAAYGTGMINDFLWVFNPFAHDPSLNLLVAGEVERKAYLDMRAEFPEDFPFRVFPEPGGLLPWGGDGKGDTLHWRTQGEPASWPTVVYDMRSAQCYEYDQPMTVFLHGLLTRTLGCPLIHPNFLWDLAQFLTINAVNR